MTAKIPQTKTTALQSISHPDAFRTTGAIDSTFMVWLSLQMLA
jgi:hypothetical protein